MLVLVQCAQHGNRDGQAGAWSLQRVSQSHPETYRACLLVWLEFACRQLTENCAVLCSTYLIQKMSSFILFVFYCIIVLFNLCTVLLLGPLAV